MQLISDARDKGAAIVLSSHVLADVEKICDRIGLIFNGNLVKVGTLSELRESKVHDIEIVFSNNFDTSKLTDLANVQRVDQDGRTVRARIMGPISPILRILNQEEILELDSRELSLEEVFFSEFTR
jgi:ABC-2 type transport system ATP-binding protein